MRGEVQMPSALEVEVEAESGARGFHDSISNTATKMTELRRSLQLSEYYKNDSMKQLRQTYVS